MFSAKHKLPFDGLVKSQAVEAAIQTTENTIVNYISLIFAKKYIKTDLFIRQSQKFLNSCNMPCLKINKRTLSH